jgi:SAM-dependent methyltransferase
MNNPNHLIDYYNKFSLWGVTPTKAKQKRITVTQSLLPSDTTSILDLGCGDGVITNQIAENGINVVDADFSQIALKFAKGKRVLASVDSIPFADQQFDTVVCAETIEHLPDGIYEKTLSEIERVACRYIIISTPNQEYLPDANIKCEQCGNIFHRDQHVRRLDSNIHKNFFRKFERKKTVGVHFWYQSPWLTNFQQKTLNIYTPWRNTICSACGYNKREKIRAFQYFIFGIKHAFLRFIPGAKKEQWIVSFYERITL